jgi:hypothetical protein
MTCDKLPNVPSLEEFLLFAYCLAQEAGVVSIRVRDPEDRKRLIEAIIACLA